MQLLHNMENKTILLVNDKYRKMENFYFYDKMPYLSVFFYILRRIRMEENFFILFKFYSTTAFKVNVYP